MKNVTITLYQFNELGDEAQERALDKHRYINVEYDKWYEFAFDDFVTICKTIGIIITAKDIFFSGFYSQGDGSAFNATIDLIPFINGIRQEAWRSYAPNVEITIPELNIDKKIIRLIESGCIDAQIATQYLKQNYLRVEADFDYTVNRCKDYNLIDYQLDLLRNWIKEALGQINSYLYKSLQEEYEAQTSNQCIQETLATNEYLFTIDGKQANRLLRLANH